MKLINDYGEKKVELYYRNNYRGGKSKEYEDLCFEESASDEESDNNNIKFKNNENGNIFDESVKDNIDNVTIMTTINNSNLNNEKIEFFSENKFDKSNDITLYELMDIVKKGKHSVDKIKEKNKNNEKKFKNKEKNEKDDSDKNNNLNSKNENNNTNINNNTNNNFNKSNKSNKSKKKKE